MKKIILIIPYFGNLPDYFPFFIKSVKYNPDVHFMIITDNEVTDVPSNVIIKKMTFKQLVSHIKSVFNFKICLESPYKLVDYKPAYGYIFEKFISDYDMWGYCDMDQIFGDILAMLPQNYNQYDKLFSLGHFTLFKNNFENNRLFMSGNVMDYKKVFQTNYIHVFDEIKGIESIFQSENKKIYNDNLFADIGWKTSHFERVYSHSNNISNVEYHNQNYDTYVWDNGKLFGIMCDLSGDIIYKELMYIHFQKRKLSGSCLLLNEGTSFLITYKGFENYNKNNDFRKRLKTFNKANFWLECVAKFKYIYYIWKRRFNKYLLRK